jgi:hypothetical protein
MKPEGVVKLLRAGRSGDPQDAGRAEWSSDGPSDTGNHRARQIISALARKSPPPVRVTGFGFRPDPSGTVPDGENATIP